MLQVRLPLKYIQVHFKRHIGHTNVFFVYFILRILLVHDFNFVTYKVLKILKLCEDFEGTKKVFFQNFYFCFSIIMEVLAYLKF